MELNVYIAGKVTCEDPETCKAKFAATEEKLKKIGVHTVINPLQMGIPNSWTRKQSIEKGLDVLKKNANAIFLLDDWVYSTESQEEFCYAKNHGYRVFDKSDFGHIADLVKHSGKWIDTSHLEFP